MFKHLTLLSLLFCLAAPALAQEEEAAAASVESPRVSLTTNFGEIVIELDAEKAPKSAENFLQYVRDGHYDGTVFHRVIDNFMIQGGGFTGDLRLKSVRPGIQNEANNGLSNLRGTVAMARTGDPHSANAQFFINVVDNTRLDFVSEQSGHTWGYTVFGRVVSGMEVVDTIRALETGAGGPFAKDVPVQPAIIESARVIEGGDEAG